MDREETVRLIPYVNLFNYGETVIHADNAALTSYGLLHKAAAGHLRVGSVPWSLHRHLLFLFLLYG
jgi:hypothetical protein